MVRVATELRDALIDILQVEQPDSPLLRHLIDSYRDIARELGQQNDVEHALSDLLPSARAAAHGRPVSARHSPRRISPNQTSRKSPSR